MRNNRRNFVWQNICILSKIHIIHHISYIMWCIIIIYSYIILLLSCQTDTVDSLLFAKQLSLQSIIFWRIRLNTSSLFQLIKSIRIVLLFFPLLNCNSIKADLCGSLPRVVSSAALLQLMIISDTCSWSSISISVSTQIIHDNVSNKDITKIIIFSYLL